MKIEINPRSLLNLENICEVLYKLHPKVLYELVGMQRSIGSILGMNDMNDLSLEQREKIINNGKDMKHFKIEKDNFEDELQKLDKDDSEDDEDCDFKKMIDILHGDGDYPEDIFRFNKLLKYLQLNTYEYIPIKINVEVEDPVIGKKVRELVQALETTRAPEQFYLNKRELDYHAYFAEGYNNLSMTEEQKKKYDDLFSKHDPEKLEKLLVKEKLYP